MSQDESGRRPGAARTVADARAAEWRARGAIEDQRKGPPMIKHACFGDIADEISYLERLRDKAIANAFQVLEVQDAALAHLLLLNLGDRKRAAYWMCLRQRIFRGRSAYELLAEGDVDLVWDQVLGDANDAANMTCAASVEPAARIGA